MTPEDLSPKRRERLQPESQIGGSGRSGAQSCARACIINDKCHYLYYVYLYYQLYYECYY